ncbi:MAG: hypothetical protein CMN76_04025 [Spirochaetaceae bacterium]|nr:hypothetical protein [Spirochaetaceae bacterium]
MKPTIESQREQKDFAALFAAPLDFKSIRKHFSPVTKQFRIGVGMTAGALGVPVASPNTPARQLPQQLTRAGLNPSRI